MMEWQLIYSSMMFPVGSAGMFFGAFLLPLLVWSAVWKGLALWHAARRGELYWFIAILIINTLGILEILYLYVFGGRKEIGASGGITPNTPPQQ